MSGAEGRYPAGACDLLVVGGSPPDRDGSQLRGNGPAEVRFPPLDRDEARSDLKRARRRLN